MPGLSCSGIGLMSAKLMAASALEPHAGGCQGPAVSLSTFQLLPSLITVILAFRPSLVSTNVDPDSGAEKSSENDPKPVRASWFLTTNVSKSLRLVVF